MSHRVITGSAKGIRLKPVPGNSTRPIMDRAKEALFSILGQTVIEAQVLDLFAGTGAVGIEALSRGADFVTFIDLDREAIKTIHTNVAATKFTDQCEILRCDAFDFLTRPLEEPYSLIYIAPPQYKGLWKRAILALDEHPGVMEPDAIVIIQIDPKEKETLELKHLRAYDERTYGKTLLWFFEYEDGEVDEPPQ